MAKISLSRVLGRNVKQNAPLISRKQTWTSRISQLPRRTLYSLIIGILFVQAFITYRTLFYEPPLPQAPPYNVTETVALVTRYYELLIEMQYLGPDSIDYPPHTSIKTILARSMGLTSAVIETMKQLPYLNHNWGGWMGDRDIIFRDGRFVDYRKERDIYMSRDPLGSWPVYNEKHTDKSFEEDMLDWEDLFPKSALPLTMVRGGMYATGDAIVLDTAQNRIHVISTQGDANYDPFILDMRKRNEKLDAYKIKPDFFGPKIQYAREANDFLRDMIFRTAGLREEFVPGGPWLSRGYTPELCPPKWETWVRDLYRRSGWPSEWDMAEYLFPINGTASNPLKSFRVEEFRKQIEEVKHNISVRYMPDWYTPLPRDEENISWLEQIEYINEEQATFARSAEEVIPINLGESSASWGRMHYLRHWELFGAGNWNDAQDGKVN